MTAIFSNANMQSIAGLADPAINKMHVAGTAPIPTATIHFYSEVGLGKEIARRKELGLNYRELEEILSKFPVNQIPGELRHRIGDE